MSVIKRHRNESGTGTSDPTRPLDLSLSGSPVLPTEVVPGLPGFGLRPTSLVDTSTGGSPKVPTPGVHIRGLDTDPSLVLWSWRSLRVLYSPNRLLFHHGRIWTPTALPVPKVTYDLGPIPPGNPGKGLVRTPSPTPRTCHEGPELRIPVPLTFTLGLFFQVRTPPSSPESPVETRVRRERPHQRGTDEDHERGRRPGRGWT